MNIIEAISDSLNEVTKLTDKYIGRIYIDGKINYAKPVDVRVNKINIPLQTSNLSFIYDETSKEERIHKCDAILDVYYPQGSELILSDGPHIILISYGQIKRYKDTEYVDMYCKLKDESVCLIETIHNDMIENRVTREMNRIIESNEIIKGLLPQYDANWLKFNDEDIDAIEKFNAMNVLSVFDRIGYDEQTYMARSINSSVKQNYDILPDTVMVEIEELTDILIDNRIRAGFMSYYSLYNPRYVFEGILYIFENMLLNDDTLYNEFYLLNKLEGKCKIAISRTNDKIVFVFDTPSESKNNYRLIINNYKVYGQYTKYNIESIELYQIDKETLYEKQITNVSDNQGDYLKVCTEIISIISASNYEETTLSEYYDSIEKLFNEINTKKHTEPEQAE